MRKKKVSFKGIKEGDTIVVEFVPFEERKFHPDGSPVFKYGFNPDLLPVLLA